MMAYRLERYDALRILCDHGVNPMFNPYPGVASAFEMALSESNKEALKHLGGLILEARLSWK